MKRTAFTLIELLIVVAIIGILAAIAVPNFMRAQIQAKIASAQSDMRSVGVAVELYHADHGTYPRQGPENTCNIALRGLRELTTPTAYITAMPPDLFHRDEEHSAQPLKYGVCNSEHTYWYVWSVGPDQTNQYAGSLYDSSNGLLSPGDLKRTTASDRTTTAPQ